MGEVSLSEYCDWRETGARVDEVRGVIEGVKILGMESRNGRSYSEEALRGAAAMYEGAKVNVNHPRGGPSDPRDYQDRLGVIRGVDWRAGEGLFGDLHFNPKHALAEQLVWDARHAPQNVGFSHNVLARTARREGRTVVEAIVKVQSVDLVADPATTRGLFEEAGAREGAGEFVREAGGGGEPAQRESADEAEELTAIREENARLRAEGAALRRRAAIERLLAEHGLPSAGSSDEAGRRITSAAFVETLEMAEGEPAMRAAVADRARLVEWLRKERGEARRPVSREQRLGGDSSGGPADAAEFVRAIRR